MGRVVCCWLFAASVATTLAAQTSVVVTNSGNALNGDVRSIAALNAKPGADGISFVEAVAAANNTAGEKVIRFAPALDGVPIVARVSDNSVAPIALTRGDITIDGDIDGDGAADVILDGSGNVSGQAIDIRSSNVTLNGLILREFPDVSIMTGCLDRVCQPRTISNIRITNNTIETSRGSGIEVGVWGLLLASDTPFLNDFTFSDFAIENNTFRVSQAAMGIRPGAGGTSRNTARNFVVRNNRVTGGKGVDVGAADDATPPMFGQDNVLEDLVVEDNFFEECGVCVDVYASDLGNSSNVARHVRVRNNHFNRWISTAMYFAAAVEPRTAAPTSLNVLDDLVVEGNILEGGRSFGIMLGAGDVPSLQGHGGIVDQNVMTNVAIRDNTVTGYYEAGIVVRGGIANPAPAAHHSVGNRIEGLVISGNVLQPDPAFPFTTGLDIVAGDERGGIVENNQVSVSIVANTFRGNQTAVRLTGGSGAGARRNELVVATLADNTFEQNETTIALAVDTNGGAENRVRVPRRRAVSH